MKRIVSAVAMLLLAVSCSNWTGNNDNPQLAVRMVAALHLADASVSFTYNSEFGFVSDVEYSDGRSYHLDYEHIVGNDYVVTITSSDGSPTRQLNITAGFLMMMSRDGHITNNLEYLYSGCLTNATDYDHNAKSQIRWSGGSVTLPDYQTNTWYGDAEMSSDNVVARKSISYEWSSVSGVNAHLNASLLPVLVPEYVECTGIDCAIISALGALRTYYLPVKVTIMYETADDIASGSSENAETVSHDYTFDYDPDGYLRSVYSVDESGRSELVVGIVYAK